MGRPDRVDRIVQGLIASIAILTFLNGARMLLAPAEWYQSMPTVPRTGPLNIHFVQDIGLAFGCSGLVLLFAAVDPKGRWQAVLAGTLWPGVHAILHVVDVARGHTPVDMFWADAPGLLGPPVIVVAAIGVQAARQRISPAGVPTRAFLAIADRMPGADSAYLHELATAPGRALGKFQMLMPATMHRFDAPPEPFHMARLGATLVEDCGPCALIAAHGALSDGVGRDLINAALAGRLPDGPLGTAFRFGEAIANHSVDAVALGEAIDAHYGRTTRLELAMTAATVRVYPAMKRGLGRGQVCALTRLQI